MQYLATLYRCVAGAIQIFHTIFICECILWISLQLFIAKWVLLNVRKHCMRVLNAENCNQIEYLEWNWSPKRLFLGIQLDLLSDAVCIWIRHACTLKAFQYHALILFHFIHASSMSGWAGVMTSLPLGSKSIFKIFLYNIKMLWY